MLFRIADTFTDSLARLSGGEQKAAKLAAFELQMNPARPGLKLHRLDKARDPSFWSVRVSRDLRIVVHRREQSLLLCYVDHHDDAYRWAERRRLEVHPSTGAAQLVEIREIVEDVVRPREATAEAAAKAKPALFAQTPDSELLGYGVPEEWLGDVRAATEDTVLDVADHLPAEAAEALLTLAVGGRPEARAATLAIPPAASDVLVRSEAPPASAEARAFEHPDAQRRFRVIADREELERALEFPWEKWTVFLHPAQRELVERDYNGPARVFGSAGTGKTIVALHHAVYLARQDPDARILLATFSDALARALRIKLRRLIGSQPRLAERIQVDTLDQVALRLFAPERAGVALATPQTVRELIEEAAAAATPARVSPRFLVAEWEQVVDAWQLISWDAYRDVARLGRRTRLPETQRAALWAVFAEVWTALKNRALVTMAGIFTRLAEQFAQGRKSPFEHIIVDEAQDVSVAQLRFLAALAAPRPNGLFFAGDLGQRIFQQPFSWKALGVDVRGRARRLRINYRTSHQIRMQADRLLGAEVTDVDGNVESREGMVSVFNGPSPAVESFPSTEGEAAAVARWLSERHRDGVAPQEMGLFVRSAGQLARATAAVGASGLPYQVLDARTLPAGDAVTIGTMHLAKGLEFRAVAVMACDDEVIPLQSRIDTVADDAELEEVYDTERHLLYVACTRAREHLLVTGVEPASEFLDDLCA
jgi:hypothetical protein